jgi:hypothetical protein
MAITQVSNNLVKQDLTISGGTVDNTVIGSGTPAAGTFTTVAGTLASTVTGTTAAASDNSTKIATTAYVTTALANLVDSAPGTLNTLNELAAALGDDASFSTTVTNSIATKLPLAGGTLTGDLNFGDNDKAIFGAGSDFEIFHDSGSGYSQIKETGPAGLLIRSNDLRLQSSTGENGLIVTENGAVTAYYDNSAKLATASTGINVTGSVVSTAAAGDHTVFNSTGADADFRVRTGANTHSLYVQGNTGNVGIGTNSPRASLDLGAGSGDGTTLSNTSSDYQLILEANASTTGDIGRNIGWATGTNTVSAAINSYDAGTGVTNGLIFATAYNGSLAQRMRIDSSGDISFYEDTGTTAKLFWDASTESLGIGTTTPFNSSIHATGKIRAGGGTSGGFLFGSTDFDTGMITPADGNLAFIVDNVERIRISSGNVGIGESDPSGYWAQADNLVVGGTGNDGITIKSSTVGNGRLVFTDTKSSTAGLNDGGMIHYDHTADKMIFQVNGSERMRIDSSGNVGIGISPSTDFHIKGTTSFDGDGSSRTEITSATASSIVSLNIGGIDASPSLARDVRFFTNVASNAKTERMRIDSNGNVGINTTDISAIFKVRATAPGYTNNGTVFWGGTTNSESHTGISLNSAGDALFGSVGSNIYYSNSATATQSHTNRSSGEIRFGNTTGSSVTSEILFGGYVKGSTTFTERMRIDTSGNLLLATTTTGGTFSVVRNGNTYNINAVSDANNTTEGFFRGYSTGAGADRVIIYSNGNIVNANNSYGALSDLKLKENIVDSGSQWDDVKSVRVRKYSMKVDQVGEANQLGVIAQELESSGLTNLVYESIDRDIDGTDLGTTTKQVKYSILYMKAVKALQEAMYRIETLESKVQQLENN